MNHTIHTDKNINRTELASLLGSVGFGSASDYDEESLSRSISGSAFAAYALDSTGKLVGYLSALSDGVFTAFVDMVIVHPSFQKEGIGKALVETVEKHFAGIPIYVMPFDDQKVFFEKQGYRIPGRPMQALSKRNPLSIA